MKFTEYKEFEKNLKSFSNIAKKGESVIVLNNGKPIFSISKINDEDLEDFILSKHFTLEKKAQMVTSNNLKTYSSKESKKRLGI